MSWSAEIGEGLSLVLARAAPGPPRAAGAAALPGAAGSPAGESPSSPGTTAPYSTARLRRGLLLMDGGADLSEEGVGFGVPVVKRGRETLFPGALEVIELSFGSRPRLVALYTLDLVERLRGAGGDVVDRRGLYGAKDALAALHRRAPALRGPLTTVSSLLRASLGWTTVYERAGATAGTVAVAWVVDPAGGVLTVDVDLTGLAPDVGEAVVMNEQGARCFDGYVEDGGAPRDAAGVATWDRVRAPRAAFVSGGRRVAFWALPADGARLYRGRELVGARLAWAGFGYSVSPAVGRLRYEIAVERLA